ncbi:hypothetical protein KEG38_39155 [Polyangium jinanense]|uniref:hypothetical protein n=1 Tax=Polyangium jinanense TaxID=2829994 RepID=UPI0023407A60|nr:hypothetical protein [Polyangium jinanense]MDC3959938.1 hypothetical protein [Polyangium jinanense]
MAKQVTDRQGAVALVASAADTHAVRLQQKFQAIFAEHLKPGEVMPDVGLVANLIGRRLGAVNTALVEKSDAYDRELSDDAGPRERRDEAAARLTSEIVEIRGTLEAAYGPAVLRELGLDGKTEVEPKAILAKAKRLVDELGRPVSAWPKPRRKGVMLDPAAWVSDLLGPIATLEQALADVAREAREAQAASDAKATAMAHNDDVFARSAGCLSGLLRLVAEDTLARQVRPSGRRPGRVAEPEESASGEEPSPEGQEA